MCAVPLVSFAHAFAAFPTTTRRSVFDLAQTAAWRKLYEPARVPCCDFPADHVPPGGRKGDAAPVDLRKALWVAEKVGWPVG